MKTKPVRPEMLRAPQTGLHIPAVLCLTLLLAATCAAAEVHSNSLGGGRWSEANTWAGKTVPIPVDEVVIAARDTVIFDRDDADKLSCKALSIDPNGTLAFQNGGGKKRLNIAGPVEMYGCIKMDGTGAATDIMEIHLVSEKPEERAIRLLRGSSLLLMGREGLPEETRNVLLASDGGIVADITANGRAMIDIQRAALFNIHISAASIDNTGSKPNERLNVVQNRLSGLSRMTLGSCDTPLIKKNQFLCPTNLAVGAAAINAYACPLAEIRDNTIQGRYTTGVQVYGECSVQGNTIEKCGVGIYWHGANAMIKQNTVRDCETGLNLYGMSGSIEDTSIEQPKTAINAALSVAQLTSVNVTGLSTNVGMLIEGCSMTLLNCNVKPDQIKLGKTPHTQADLPWVQTMNYLVIQVNGKTPAKCQVEVQTAQPAKPLKEGVADLNIRNSPAMLQPNGMTALPKSLVPLIVKSWAIGRDGKKTEAPEYTLSVWEPPPKQGEKPKTLLTQKIRPDDSWYRLKPNDPKPTIEVTLP